MIGSSEMMNWILKENISKIIPEIPKLIADVRKKTCSFRTLHFAFLSVFTYFLSMLGLLYNKKKLLVFRIIAACIGIFGLIYRLIFNPLHAESAHNRLFQLGFFSVQSFIFTTLIFVLLVINQLRGNEDAWPTPPFRGAALLYGIITATLFGAFFAHTFEVRGFNAIVLYSNHVLMPLLMMVDNIISIPPGYYKFDLLIYWMIYPLYYLVFTIYESLVMGINRYYFLILDNANTKIYPYIIFLMGTMFLICAALIIFINKIYKTTDRSMAERDTDMPDKFSGTDR